MIKDRRKTFIRKKFACPHCKGVFPEDFLKNIRDIYAECLHCKKTFCLRTEAIKLDVKVKDERQEERYLVSLDITYNEVGKFIKDYTVSVSKGGMFVKTDIRYDVGDVVDLYLRIPNLNEPITIRGEVVYTNFTAGLEESGVGIKFLEIDRDSREKVIAYIKQWQGG